jgi:hypothetical protein
MSSPTESPNVEHASPPARHAGVVRPRALEPEDRCVRCGRPTPAGVSLCPADNPGGIGAPSATQVHGTILLGVIIGVVVIALAARLAVARAGPFEATVSGSATHADGTVEVLVHVENQGQNEGPATCRISFGGAAGGAAAADLSFVTDRIPAGGAQDVTHTVAAGSVAGSRRDPEPLTVRCD